MSDKGEPGPMVSGQPRVLLYVADSRHLTHNASQLPHNQIHTTIDEEPLHQEKHIIEINRRFNPIVNGDSEPQLIKSNCFQLSDKQNHGDVRTSDYTVLDPSYLLKEYSDCGSSVEKSAKVYQESANSENLVFLRTNPQVHSVVVPIGWRRELNAGQILYISPSREVLGSLQQVREYLQTTGTCKCGLPCPLRPENLFCFDPKVQSKPYQFPANGDLTKLCNHKRKLLASLMPPGTNIESVIDVNNRSSHQTKAMPQRTPQPNYVDYKVWQEQHLAAAASANVGNARVNSNNTYKGQPLNVQMDTIENNSFVNRSVAGHHYLTVNNGLIKAPSPCSRQPDQNHMVMFENTSAPHSNQYQNQNFQQTKNGYNQVGSERSVKAEISQAKTMVSNFCGSKPTLTPEVIQNINQQQQLFIQQNQKQIEMAMKALKNQQANVDQIALNNQMEQISGSFPGSNIAVQGNTVYQMNQQRTPPWQIKKEVGGVPPGSPVQRILFEQTEGIKRIDTCNQQGDNCRSQDSKIDQFCYARTSPLLEQSQDNFNQSIHSSQKKMNHAKNVKKTKMDPRFGVHGNNYQKSSGDVKNEFSAPHPSFMDDPSGYLAQQTVLLNNTISKPLETFEPNRNNQNFNMQNKHSGKNSPPKQYNHHVTPQFIPDSSYVNNQKNDSKRNIQVMNNVQYCPNFANNHKMEPMRKDKQNIYGNKFQMEDDFRNHHQMSFDENNMITSTYPEGPGSRNCLVDQRGPIQAGAISTSHGSPNGSLQLPEASPTPSNSSRNTDTPHSNNSGSIHISSSCNFTVPSPAYSNPGSYKEGSDPPTPVMNTSPGPSQPLSNNQILNFISNHNVNKNLLEKDDANYSENVSKANDNVSLFCLESKYENSYCPPPHMGANASQTVTMRQYQSNGNSVACGQTVMRDTITSVLAGKTHTATTSVNSANNFQRVSVQNDRNEIKTYTMPPNQPDSYHNSVSLSSNYPLHLAGTTAQNILHKSPLEMVQSVVNNVPNRDKECHSIEKVKPIRNKQIAPTVQASQILISSSGQIVLTSQNSSMPPPAPKCNQQVTNSATNNQGSVTQVLSGMGNVNQVLNQQTMLVNALPGQLVIQPQIMTVDGQLVSQNALLPQIVTGNVMSPGKPRNESYNDMKHGLVQRLPMLSPDNKKKGKKRKQTSPNITSVLHIAAPQTGAGSVILQNSPQHPTSPQFSPRGFQLSPNQNISPTQVLQALTIVPSKTGGPPQIVMNGQNSGGFSSQQLINTSPTQQINLLQPVNLLNGGVPNFSGFQQFIVPNLSSGMVMTADGTLLQETQGIPMQLQFQNVNGQNILTPMQNLGTNTSPGVVIRTQNGQGKVLQSQTSPGAQFLSPNGTIVVNNNFNSQLSPLIAFETSPRSKTMQEPHQLPIPATSRSNQSVPNTQFQNTILVRQSAPVNDEAIKPTTQMAQQSQSVAYANDLANSKGRLTAQNSRSAIKVSPDSTAQTPPDTTTTSPEPDTSAMVQCVSSSEQDNSWNIPDNRIEIIGDTFLSQEQQSYHNASYEDSYNQNFVNAQNNFYDRKRKSELQHKSEKIRRTSYADVHNSDNTVLDPNLINFDDSKSNHFFSEQDIYGTNEKVSTADDQEAEPSSISEQQFQVGDLVWGPIKGHPAWPGKLIELRDGKPLVKWFGGDKTTTQVEMKSLRTLDEGLDAHHQSRTKGRKSRKLNSHLEKAIQEAMSELDKMTNPANTSDGPASRQSPKRKKSRKQKVTKNVRGLVKIAPHPDTRLRSSQNR